MALLIRTIQSGFYFPTPKALDWAMDTLPKGPIGTLVPKPCALANKLPVACPTPAAFPPLDTGGAARGEPWNPP